MAEKLLSIAQVCQRVPVAPSRIYELLGGLQFPLPIKTGRRNFWREAEIDEWVMDLAKQRDAAAPSAAPAADPDQPQDR